MWTTVCVGGWKAVLGTVCRRGGYYIAFLLLTLEGGRETYTLVYGLLCRKKER